MERNLCTIFPGVVQNQRVNTPPPFVAMTGEWTKHRCGTTSPRAGGYILLSGTHVVVRIDTDPLVCLEDAQYA